MNRQNIPQYNCLLYNIPVANVIPTGGGTKIISSKIWDETKAYTPSTLA